MANRFWVGGTGTWDTTSTTNWSATTGGAGGASNPTSVDVAIFDANSGGGTVTISEDITVQGFNSGGFTGTIDFNNKIVNLAGNGFSVYIGSATPTMAGNPQVNLTYSGSVGARTVNPGAGVLESNAVNFTVTAGSDTVNISGNGFRVKNLTFNPAFTGTFTRPSAGGLYGNLTLHSGMIFTASASTLSFVPTTTQTITTGGLTLDCPITKDSTGTLQLQDNLTMGSTRTFTLTAGTLDLSSGNRTLSTGIFSSSNSNVRSIAFGTGNITVTGNAATIWSTGTTTNLLYTGTPVINLTYSGSVGTRTLTTGGVGINETNSATYNISAGTDTIALASSTSNFKNLNFTGFAGVFTTRTANIFGSLTISSGMTCSATTDTLTFAATSGTQQITTNGKTLDFPLTFNGIGGTFAFQDGLTQGSTRAFTITNGTVQLKNGVTSTVGAFATSGTSQKFLQSTTPGSQATLSQASGTVTASNLTIRDINAVGGATWNAFVDQGNVDAGNNDGWDFGISPVIGGAEYTYQLRSFTQPRRF